MVTYRRVRVVGGTYFFTVVTHERRPWLCDPKAREALRNAVDAVRSRRPFEVDAWVLLPDHMHCLWSLPEGDHDFSTRWRLIKAMTTKTLGVEGPVSESREKRKEGGLWQRRYWEHAIRDDEDFERHCDYIHYNPVRHGLARAPGDWPFSTFRRFVKRGLYPGDWGAGPVEMEAGEVGE